MQTNRLTCHSNTDCERPLANRNRIRPYADTPDARPLHRRRQSPDPVAPLHASTPRRQSPELRAPTPSRVAPSAPPLSARPAPLQSAPSPRTAPRRRSPVHPGRPAAATQRLSEGGSMEPRRPAAAGPPAARPGAGAGQTPVRRSLCAVQQQGEKVRRSLFFFHYCTD